MIKELITLSYIGCHPVSLWQFPIYDFPYGGGCDG